jgi:formylglycine-generating enzyme required for sulfatase activity
MVRIDVGTIAVGRSAAAVERECRALGSACDPGQLAREVPASQATIPAFFLDQYEVTNDELAQMLTSYTGILVMIDDEEAHYPRYVRRAQGLPGQELLADLSPKFGGLEYVRSADGPYRFQPRPGQGRLPAVQVSWYGAALYCETRGKRLPTENEWEAAARGRDDRRFPWGNEAPRCADLAIPDDGKLAMSGRCPLGDAVAIRWVGAAAQDVTPDGVHDLGGNVAEWTSSLFVEGNRAAHIANATGEAARTIRGGSWAFSAMARSSGRTKRPPSVMAANLGFRCASDAADARP